MWLLVIAVIILILYFVLKPYFVKYDTILAFTGGLGSGKSLLSAKTSLKILKKQRLKVRFHNLKQHFKKKKNREFWDKPVLYSSIPVRISRNEMSFELTDEHLTCRKKLPLRCVVFIDEIGSYCSQWDYNISDAFNEFVRLFRHYTKGGYMVVNDQASSNIQKDIRTRIPTVHNLLYFKKWFWIFYTVKVRNITISEDVTSIEENNSENNMSTLFGFMPIGKLYDTYCYSDRYRTVPQEEEKHFKQFKKYRLMKINRNKAKPLTTDEEPNNI